MKTKLLTFVLLFSIHFLSAQSFYDKNWKKVEKYEISLQPKSALNQVEIVYSKAKVDNNATQLVKSIIYKSKFALLLSEDAQLKVVNDLKAEIDHASFPTKNILESVLANLYLQYYQKNRYRIYERTYSETTKNENDFRVWDIRTLFYQIDIHFQNALADEELLKQTDLSLFDYILQTAKNSKVYRNTLYDFIANEALIFYETNERYLTDASFVFTINNPDLLADNSVFLDVNIISKDTLSKENQAIRIYKKLTKFHLEKGEVNPLVDITLNRLDFVRENAGFKNIDSLYIQSLRGLKEKYFNDEISTEIDFRIALFFRKEANLYNKISQEHRFKFKEVLSICDDAIKRSPKSKGAINCQNLKSEILGKYLNITAEEYVIPNRHNKVLVNYKNVDSLYFKIYPVSYKDGFSPVNSSEEFIDWFNNKRSEKYFSIKLKNEFDYRLHTTEVIIPKLNEGKYLIMVSNNKSITDDELFAYKYVTVTNLALVKIEDEFKNSFQIVNRNNGAPIKNAKLKINGVKYKRKHKKQIKESVTKRGKTNNAGFINIYNKQYLSNVNVEINTKNETVLFSNHYLSKRNRKKPEVEDEEELVVKPFLFLDRSIYRPGQKVFFKGILTTKKGDKTGIVANEEVYVSVEDTNGNEIYDKLLRTNDFGSFTDNFIIPNNVLTGEFEFYIDEGDENSHFYDELVDEFDDRSFNFLVEEYKRPRFSAEFNPVKESFKVNDSITISGNAIAFAGSNITNAKVKYIVKRKVLYSNWYRGKHSNSKVISLGEVLTNDEGVFEIKFIAEPDSKVKKEGLPIFRYEINADITDISGETRSIKTIVKVGYHTLNAKILINDVLYKKSKNNNIILETTNLNGQFAKTKGQIKIYKLIPPKNTYRKRPWQIPDYQEISQKKYEKFFPNEQYAEIDKIENWERGAVVFTTLFDTSNASNILLRDKENWISGKYVAILNCKDKFGQKVTDKRFFELRSKTDEKVYNNELFYIGTDKSTYAVGEEVNVTVSSACDDITVMLFAEHGGKIIDTQLVHLNKDTKHLKFKVNKNDLKGFYIKYYYTVYNSFKSNSIYIKTTKQNKELKIETIIFRDKLKPNQEETWSFKIKGDKNDKVLAEILASMYDSSLDQFKKHNWSMNTNDYNRYYDVSRIQSNNFSDSNFRIKNYTSYYRTPNIYKFYDKLNWFGLSFSNSYLNNKYLEKITKNRIIQEPKVTGTNRKNNEKGYVSGVVSDEMGPIADISVMVKGVKIGTVTDFDGNFTIKVNKADELIFSHVSYSSLSVKVKKKNYFYITMSESGNCLDEVVVTALGIKREKKSVGYSVTRVFNRNRSDNDDIAKILSGEVIGVTISRVTGQPGESAFVRIRGVGSIKASSTPLYVIDGVVTNTLSVSSDEVLSLKILKDADTTALYGSRASNGVIVITTISGQAKIDSELEKIKPRTNFNETAFFFPQLKTDKDGNVSFSFTAPESLTKWKMQLLAHTKDLHTAIKTLETVTQKELMVLPNPPRFLREGDEIVISSKIANLTDKQLSGQAQLELFDAITNKNITKMLMQGSLPKGEMSQSDRVGFSVNSKGNTNVSWTLHIPENIQAVQYKIVAKAGDYSDGEQNVLPVLSNRMLVTETMPMWIRSNQTKTFTLDKLKNTVSSTRKNHKLTLEVTSNPAWYAVQALPYLMEYPYECAEQTFSRYYANTLASYIANSNPKIQEVFNQWKNSDTLLSNLEKNQELKSLIIQETPWLRDAQSETEQKKRIALLFDLNKMKNEQESAVKKLKQLQMSSGGFPWFKGSRYENRYITQHIIAGFGHLAKLNVYGNDGVIPAKAGISKMNERAISYLDNQILKDYNKLLDNARRLYADDTNKEQKIKEYMTKNHTSHFQVHYLYTRSFYKDIKVPRKVKAAFDYYTNQSYEFWKSYNLYSKGLISLIAYRNDNNGVANKVIKSLKENSITSEELGMYWKENTNSYYWYQAPIETQALLIEAFAEVNNAISTEPESVTKNLNDVDNLKIWLLKNKQTNRWKTTKATTEAVYALLLQGTDWLETTEFVDITIGNKTIKPLELDNVKVEAGTGYYKTSWNGSEITPEMAEVTIKKEGKGISWGAMYWQYFEDLDKITMAETPLKLKKKLFLKTNEDRGEKITEITKDTKLQLGDLVRVRIELRVDRAMEFIHMKDMRAAGFEPVNVLSQYKWQDGLGYYEATKDASTNFFIDYLPKGVYVFEYDLRVNNKGDFSNGITTIQSMYAPEFSSHSEGVRVKID